MAWNFGVACVLCGAIVTAPALADTGASGSVSTDRASAAAPTPATGPTGPVKRAAPVRLVVSIKGAYSYRGRRYALPRERVTISGTVTGDFDGQKLTVVIKRGGRTIKSREVRLKASDGRSGFEFKYRSGTRGKAVISTEIPVDLSAAVTPAKKKSLTVTKTNVSRGHKSVSIRLIQVRLAALGYVVPRGGRFDAGTGRALMAFRKVTGMARNELAGSNVVAKLAAGKGRFKLKYPGGGRHIEVDISRQVMAFASGGKVRRIYHVSTGAGGTPTVRGTYHVYRKSPGTNAKGMVHSSYFIRGYAIHGFDPVPPYNASHGCVRVPVPNAISVFRWIQLGTRVDTYN